MTLVYICRYMKDRYNFCVKIQVCPMNVSGIDALITNYMGL